METQRREFTKEEIDDAWEQGRVEKGYDPDFYRRDYADARIERLMYGNIYSQYGWEIDHIKPLAKGGTYDKNNLFPLQWKNNRTKGDDYPKWYTSISFDGKKNTLETRHWGIVSDIIMEIMDV
jgi:hypothetical protein